MTGAVIARPVIKPVPALAQVQAELPRELDRFQYYIKECILFDKFVIF